jgi:sporulation protein YlmC with PRC-barrel domain
MLVLKDRVIDVPIMSLQTGDEIARTETPIIDPRQLVIVAFYCQGPRLDHSPSILHVEDIREVSSLGYIVDSAENLMPPDDLVRLKEILDLHFELIDKQVVEDTGRKVGKVIDYTVDTKSFHILQLKVAPGIWKALQTAEIIIGRRQIVEITDTTIVVKAPTVKVEDTQAVPLTDHVVDNPFRQPPTEVAPTPTPTHSSRTEN